MKQTVRPTQFRLQTRLKHLKSSENSRARSQTAHMASRQATQVAFEDIAEAIIQWMTPKTSIHWIVPSNPEQPRVRFRVRPQFANFLALSLTCKGTYRTSFWRKAGFKRWTESRDALYNLLKHQIEGKMPVFMSLGRAVYLGQPDSKRVRVSL